MNDQEFLESIIQSFEQLTGHDTSKLENIDSSFLQLNYREKENYIASITDSVLLSKDFSAYVTNYIIDVKRDSHIKIFFEGKEYLGPEEVIDLISVRMMDSNLNYNVFQKQMSEVKYLDNLFPCDTSWVTDIPERVALKLYSQGYNWIRILGMLNLKNVIHKNLKNNFREVYNTAKECMPNNPEYVVYLLRHTLERSDRTAVREDKVFLIGPNFDAEKSLEIFKHEYYHSKYYHARRSRILDDIYNNSIDLSAWNNIIESCTRMFVVSDVEGSLMDYFLRGRKGDLILCKLLTKWAKKGKFITKNSSSFSKDFSKMILNPSLKTDP